MGHIIRKEGMENLTLTKYTEYGNYNILILKISLTLFSTLTVSFLPIFTRETHFRLLSHPHH